MAKKKKGTKRYLNFMEIISYLKENDFKLA